MKKTLLVILAILSSLLSIPYAFAFGGNNLFSAGNVGFSIFKIFLTPVIVSSIISYFLFDENTDRFARFMCSFSLGIFFVAIGVVFILAILFAACLSSHSSL